MLKKTPLKKTAEKIITLTIGTAICSAIATAASYSPAPAQESAAAAETQSAPAPLGYPMLALGSTGESVSELQATLKLLGFYQGAVDGTYSQPTLDAVAQFQTAAGISADGVTGPSTWQKLLPAPPEVTAAAEPPATPEPTAPEPTAPESAASASNVSSQAPLGPPILRAQATGSAVSQLQRELQELGYYEGPIDGGFGEQTQVSVEKFQADQQLFVDGVVGPSTWDALSEALDN
jgi:N-acetylmuramoyl-L-alanine amidase